MLPAMLSVAAETGSWSDPSAITPLIVSLVALGGVIFTNWRTGKNMITAERERARLAELAENMRSQNAIEAEDRRAKAAIEAEDRRHEYAIRQAIHAHVVDNIRDLYREIEEARFELHRSVWSAEVLSQENAGEWMAEESKERVRFDNAFAVFSAIDDRASLFGSAEVATLTGKLFSSSFRVESLLRGIDGMVPPIAPEVIDQVHAAATLTQENAAALLAQMRRELHVTDRDATT